MTVVDLINGSEQQLSPLIDLKADFQKLTEQFFTDLEKSSEKSGPVRDLIKKYQSSCQDMAAKYSKQTEERQKNAEAAAKSLQIEAKSKIDAASAEKKNKEEQE